YEQTDDLDFLKEAIALAESAVTLTTPLHPNRAILFPGADLFRRYERLGNMADLNEAIIEMEKALEACYPGTPGRAGMLHNWSTMLVKRFERLGDINDLDKAARISEDIVREAIAGSQIHIYALFNLGTILLERFKRIGNLEDLQKAIKHGEAALAATPRDHPDRAVRYSNL
ncbi:hypothetical protein L873DRAFT_1632231, partial [Choiromyces venosus 120613-1]